MVTSFQTDLNEKTLAIVMAEHQRLGAVSFLPHDICMIIAKQFQMDVSGQSIR
jgi:hypothetical protein